MMRDSISGPDGLLALGPALKYEDNKHNIVDNKALQNCNRQKRYFDAASLKGGINH